VLRLRGILDLSESSLISLSQSPAYGWLMLGGIAVSLVFWVRLARRDERLILIYVAALVGAFLGAKVAYLIAEGWMDFGQPNTWRRLATGKSILGALFGGYVAVELAKKWAAYRGVTGDWFALIAPVGIVIGRVGCLLHGCCLGRACGEAWFTLHDGTGVPRWPAVPVEILFNLTMIAVACVLRSRSKLAGQHFHVYLISYGLFRFAHEFLRDTPRTEEGVSGYQLLALGLAAFGAAAFVRRRRGAAPPAPA
jgi:phosphatidylglycerol:prolipoprotein diacylglycerol transferase